jgi:hypothetical protein
MTRMQISFRPQTIVSLPILLLCCCLQPSLGQAQTLNSLSISPHQPAVAIGNTIQLSATATYSNGSSNHVSSGVAWASSDPRTVGISSTGLASGMATGDVAIIASYQGKTASVILSSFIGDIPWDGPLTITQGGVYSGNWKSTNPNTPAVTVATTEPVVIENSHVTGPSDLISDPYWGNNLTVKNVIGIGLNSNVRGLPNGMFVDAQNPFLLDVEGCYFETVRFGIWVRGFAGTGEGNETVTILNNRGRNIVGMESDGSNGYLPGDSFSQWAHAIQLSSMPSIGGIRIAWNEIINYPYQSLVNENLSLFDAGGTANSPAEIHDNYIQGAYPYIPATGGYNGGGMVTDGSGGDTVASASAFNHFYNNQIVGTVNMGIEFSTGHDNLAYNNQIISSGLLPNGTKISAQNVGMTIYDVYGNIQRGTMYNNNMYNNTVGWMCWASRCAWEAYRSDTYFPTNYSDYFANQSIQANPITEKIETAAYSAWTDKIASNGVQLGPVSSASATAGGGGNSGSAISETAWYNVVNTNSDLCVDAVSWGVANGTGVQQYTCGSAQANQEWQFQPVGSGYYQVVNRNALTQTAKNLVWDVTGGPTATADLTPIQLWSYLAGTNQQWLPVSLGNGAYKFVARNSSKCLDVPGASSLVLTRLQLYDCNGTDAQSYNLVQK